MVTIVTPGEVNITLSGGTLAAGTLTDVASLTASVPSAAPYRNKEVLDIQNISINGGTDNGQDGSAVHAATFLDATQGPSIPSNYSAQDAFDVLKASVGLSGAFYNKLLDPTILADDSGLAPGYLFAVVPADLYRHGIGPYDAAGHAVVGAAHAATELQRRQVVH